MSELVFPDSFWTYIAFQLPPTEVDELRIAIKHPHQRCHGWLPVEWSSSSYTMERKDGSSLFRVFTHVTRNFVQFADDDKCIGICNVTGRITRLTRTVWARGYHTFDVLFLLLRAMKRFRARKQRRMVTIEALCEQRLLISDLHPLVVSYVGWV